MRKWEIAFQKNYLSWPKMRQQELVSLQHWIPILLFLRCLVRGHFAEGEQRQGCGGWRWTGFRHAVSLGDTVVAEPVSAKQELWIYFHRLRGVSFLLFPVAFIIKSTNHF